MSNQLSEEQTWNILGEHFKTKGFVQHQTSSFDRFINHGLGKIMTHEREIKIKDNYRISFSDIYVPNPTITEEDRTLRGYYPSEARQRDLTYDSPIYATVTEVVTNEGKEPIVVSHNRVVIGRIPIMLRSSRCYLNNMTPQERIKAGECEHDQGGYFLVKGKERVLISQMRGVYNIPMVFGQKSGERYKFIAEIRSMSEETGHSALLKAMIGEDDRSIVFSLPYIKEVIPVGIVFKALGYHTKKEISDFIGMTELDSAQKYIRLIIRDSFVVDDHTDGFDYFSSKQNTKNSTQVTSEWENMSDEDKLQWKNKSSQENALNYIGNYSLHILKDMEKGDYAKQVVENELFPHMGVSATNKETAYFLGRIVNKLLSTSIGIRKEDDRDNYMFKRIESAGILCHELVRQLFKKYTDAIIQAFDKKNVTHPDAISVISRLTIITSGLKHCFSTGNWGVPKNSYIRPGVSQILSRLSYGATLSNLRRLSIPVGKEAKNSKIRQIDSSQIMFICPSETPEGQPVGTVLNFSLLTTISERYPTVLMKDVFKHCDKITSIKEYNSTNDQTKILLNGILMGMTEEPEELVEELKSLRESNLFPYDVSISYDDIDDEINVLSDEGRLLRPVFTVNGDKLRISEKDGTNWDELVEAGFIRYVDNSEINNAVVAFNQNELKKYHNDYCEIAAAMMLGVMASIIPFPDHSQSPRNCYQASMGKQAMSMFALSHLIRADTISHVLSYPQRPLVSTKPANFMGFSEMPSGINAIVAIACYTGFNQEDSVIVNHSAIQRGLFWATSYRTHTDEEKKQGSYNYEKIGTPPLDKRRSDVNYGLLDEHGVIRTRHPDGGAVYVQKGDVIIGKIAVRTNKAGDEDITDCSLVVKKGEEGYIDRIFTSVTPNGYKLVKIVIRTERIPEIGDKFASRAAQKGTCGMVYAQQDMPWTAEGIVPDIIINPHCIPSRMTINQLMECVLGKSCIIEGTYGDSTPFTSSSMDTSKEICERLQMNGYNGSGTEMMYNGFTGEPIGEVFIGPVYYQRLKHLVSDKIHARAKGPVTTLTRQPLEGRSRDGGLRFGEMERDAMIAHGASKFLKERLCEQSDEYKVMVCNCCGNFATTHTKCQACDTDKVSKVNIPYISKLLIDELKATCLKIQITASC